MKFNLFKITEFTWRWIPIISMAHILYKVSFMDCIDPTQKVWIVIACVTIASHFAIKYYDGEETE